MTTDRERPGTLSDVSSVIVECRDGRQCDLTGLSPEEAISRLRALGIRPADVQRTVHHLVGGVVFAEGLPSFDEAEGRRR